jgi:hypothetical protein
MFQIDFNFNYLFYLNISRSLHNCEKNFLSFFIHESHPLAPQFTRDKFHNYDEIQSNIIPTF